jgi:hypothetical protein
MVYTNMGSQVTVISSERVDGQIWCKVRRNDGSERLFLMRELKADGGIAEIQKAVDDSR